MKLLLLRHGATEGNLRKQYIGSTDQPLAPMGRRQALERAPELPPVERLWVSTMARARETAELFYPDVPRTFLDDLREMDFGSCEEKTWEEINDPAIYDGWLAGSPDAAFPGGETLGQLTERVSRALRQIAAEALAEGVTSGAVVAHGGILMAMLYCHGPAGHGFFDWQCENCGGFETELDTETLELRVLRQIGRGSIW